MQSSPLRVAIAGQGRSGYKIHTACLRQMPEQFKIVAAADLLPARRRDAREQCGARVYNDWRTMLEAGGFDLLVNALPQTLHPIVSMEALQRGFNVVCEKPACKDVKTYDRVIATARRHRRVFAPFQNNRLQPFFDKIQEVIASGVLGKIIHVRSCWGAFARRWDWQTRQDQWGGALLNTGPHALDQALCLFGWREKPRVFCRMDCNNPFAGDADDHCTVTLYSPRRTAPQVEIIISGYMAYMPGDKYSICGAYGGLAGGERNLRWRYFDTKRAPKQRMWRWSVDRRYPSEELAWVEHTWALEQPDQEAVGYTMISLPSGPRRFYDNIHDVLLNGAELLIKPEQVRRQIEVIQECHRQNPLPRKPAPAYWPKG